jgi:hypothetical protein
VHYTETGLFRSYAIVTRHINRVGLGDKDPFACPLLEMRQTPGLDAAEPTHGIATVLPRTPST